MAPSADQMARRRCRLEIAKAVAVATNTSDPNAMAAELAVPQFTPARSDRPVRRFVDRHTSSIWCRGDSSTCKA
jgi:hypothetical protein